MSQQATTVYIVRHGETDYNARGIIQGYLDIPLNSKGQEQAVSLAKRLVGDHPIDQIFSSDLLRAAGTASIIADALDLSVTSREDLREIHLGSWEGKGWPDILAEDPGTRERYFENWWLFDEHGGESRKVAWQRISQALDEIISENFGQKILLVAHGAIIRLMIQRVIHCQKVRAPIDIDNCSLSKVVHDENGLRLSYLNDCSHLK